MKLFVALMTVLLALNCSDNGTDDGPGCSDAICTEEFRTITVSVKDGNGAAVTLDYFKVVLSNGDDVTLGIPDSDYDRMIKNGAYPLFSDTYVTKYRNSELEINFQGFAGDRLLVDSDYVVGVDCCHVMLIEGETDIVITDP